MVDAGSADDSAQVASARARTIELGHNPGFGAASNAGVAAAGAPVTVLLNPDVVLLDNSLATLARDASSADALLVPRLLNPDRSIQRSAHPLPGTARALLPALVHPRLLPRGPRLAADPWRSEARRRVGWAIAACVAAQTRILLELGPFDPEQFLFYEDMDLCLARPRARVPHRAGSRRGVGAHRRALHVPALRRRAVRPARPAAPAGRGAAPGPARPGPGRCGPGHHLRHAAPWRAPRCAATAAASARSWRR